MGYNDADYKKKWRAKNREAENAAQRARAKTPEGRERTRLKAHKYRAKVRQKILEAYGSACQCCGEQESKFLALDHIHNDGYKERSQHGASWYMKVKAAGYPKDRYQLLCHNCNMAKGFYGLCPHQEQKGEHLKEVR